MSPADAIFYVFGAMAVVGAFGVAVSRNPLAATAWLLLCLFAVAGLFAIAGAHFLAAMQVLVYAGAVTVLFVFVIMLLNLSDAQLGRMDLSASQLAGFASVLAALIAISAVAAMETRDFGWFASGAGETANIGKSLLGGYAAPFELISLLLLAAMAGAVMLTKRAHVGDAIASIGKIREAIDARNERAFQPDPALPSQQGPPPRQRAAGDEAPVVGVRKEVFGPGETV